MKAKRTKSQHIYKKQTNEKPQHTTENEINSDDKNKFLSKQ